jgi:hypothetical protein
MDRQRSYVGKTQGSLNDGYKESMRSIRIIKENSVFAMRILNKMHQFEKMEDIMDVMD